MPERRLPTRQEPRVDGRRDTDPRLTTTDVAALLGRGVTTQFVVGEIRQGRLEATVLKRGSRRAIYRIAPAHVKSYLEQYRWTPPVFSA